MSTVDETPYTNCRGGVCPAAARGYTGVRANTVAARAARDAAASRAAEARGPGQARRSLAARFHAGRVTDDAADAEEPLLVPRHAPVLAKPWRRGFRRSAERLLRVRLGRPDWPRVSLWAAAGHAGRRLSHEQSRHSDLRAAEHPAAEARWPADQLRCDRDVRRREQHEGREVIGDRCDRVAEGR